MGSAPRRSVIGAPALKSSRADPPRWMRKGTLGSTMIPAVAGVVRIFACARTPISITLSTRRKVAPNVGSP